MKCEANIQLVHEYKIISLYIDILFFGPEHEEDELVVVVTCSLWEMLIAKIEFNIWFDFYGLFFRGIQTDLSIWNWHPCWSW